MDAILELKGIPIPKDLAVASDVNRRQAAMENLETCLTASAAPGSSISAPLLPPPGPDPRTPTRPGTAPGPGNDPASAPGPGKSPGNVDKAAAGWSCAGVNYELQCQV